MQRLEGKVLLVTGAAGALGGCLAHLAVDQGAEVLLADVNDELGMELADALGDRARYFHLDVRREDQWAQAVELVRSRFGHLDVLVNNAAILRIGWLETFTVEDFNEVVAVNQLGPFLGMRAVVPAMKAVGRGSIINVSSTDGLFGREGVIAYGGSKWALRGMTKVAAQELGPFNIRVNSVHPGGMRAGMAKGVIGGPGVPADIEQVKLRWALQRFPEYAEIANVILFLASEEATYTTGAEITCDGGATIGPRYV